jgi:nucleotide-binding universal stress UspA family protein
MFNTILIPIDLAHDSSWRKALPVAIDQTRSNPGAQLYVMTVVDLNMNITAIRLPENFNQEYREKTEHRLEEVVNQQVPSDIQVQYIIRDGRIYREILAVAQEIKADLIVMASHNPALKDYLLGANAARVVRHADCSVLVVRD